jgi:DNA recombination protein RmuC
MPVSILILLLLVLLTLGLCAGLVAVWRRLGAPATDPRLADLVQRVEALSRDVHTLRELSNAQTPVMEVRLQSLSQQMQLTLDSMRADMSDRLSRMLASSDQHGERMRTVLHEQLTNLQKDNADKLEQMRKTVDDKLHATLEDRLAQSFKVVSERLEAVHRGLGEMHQLASGVGDLKRVLTNVKTRGTWGEYQLEALIEQILARDQYETNIATRPGSAERVEVAVRLPGRDTDQPVWLPIDAKFPLEDYQRLLDAYDDSDHTAIDDAAKALETRVRAEAKKIRTKYVESPHTTDFALMYLPTEGLYAEVLRRPGLADSLQRELRIVVTGPTNTAAMLNSLQMGFRTLAIEKRSSEVWNLLGEVKTEFEKFGQAIQDTEKKLAEVANKFSNVSRRARVLGTKLKNVEALPVAGATLDDPLALPIDTEE